MTTQVMRTVIPSYEHTHTHTHTHTHNRHMCTGNFIKNTIIR